MISTCVALHQIVFYASGNIISIITNQSLDFQSPSFILFTLSVGFKQERIACTGKIRS